MPGLLYLSLLPLLLLKSCQQQQRRRERPSAQLYLQLLLQVC
jgi:hypothetical protein